MADIDWHGIAVAIRENRLDDIPQHAWFQIADKIDTKKRGRGRPPDRDISREGKFCHGLFKQMKLLDGEMTWAERCLWVEDRYDQLRKDGRKSGEAIKLIAKESPWTEKTVEAALTSSRRHKGFIEACKNIPTIIACLSHALDIPLDEDESQSIAPELKNP